MKRNVKGKKFKKYLGFTLVELLAVIVILAIIMLISIPAVLDTLTVAKRKSFIEFVDKVFSKSNEVYLLKSMKGFEENCVLYDITKDLGLDNTGDFKGYVVIKKNEKDFNFFITLWDKDYIIENLKYTEQGVNETMLKKITVNYTQEEIEKIKSDLAGEANCKTYNMTDGTSGTGNVKPKYFSGTIYNDRWYAHYTNGEIDECYNKKGKEYYCTREPGYSVEQCESIKSFECCTGKKNYCNYNPNIGWCYYGVFGSKNGDDGTAGGPGAGFPSEKFLEEDAINNYKISQMD